MRLLSMIGSILAAAMLIPDRAVAAPRPTLPPDTTITKPLDRLWALRRISCGALTGLSLPHARVVFAELVSTGNFSPPGTPPGAPPVFTGLPQFCRVMVVSNPTGDSVIGIEVWAPTRDYRARYLQVGNGGFSGGVVYAALADGVKRGYATASTDDGSQALGSASFAMGRPEKIVDYGHRALKETTDSAKAIIRALNGADPVRSYFHGCSNGGRQALMEAQRYPNDFDGILAGAPANNFTRQFSAFVWNAQKIYPPGSSAPSLPEDRLPFLSDHVRAQCAGHDGGLASDRFLTNPPACKPALSGIVCDGPACISASQAETIRLIYRGARRSDTDAEIYPGYEPGAESHKCNWGLWITGKPAGAEACGWPPPHFGFQAFFGWDFFRYFVREEPGWDYRGMNFSSDVDDVDARFGPILNATNPDLSAFRNRGGKLIQYHGWDDVAVAPRNSINYWASVEAQMRALNPAFTRADLDGFYRLFMAPGLAHCVAGPGLNSFGNAGKAATYDADHDMLLALERWVEGGVAPERVIARHVPEASEAPFERPLCPYPALPRYTGSGDPASAASWACAAPRLLIPDIRPRVLPDRPIRPRL